MSTAETFERNGFTFEVVQDEDAEHLNPRENENYGLWLGLPHRSYRIGDETLDPHAERVTCSHCDGTGEEPGTEPEQDPSSVFTVRGNDCLACGGDGEVNPYADSSGNVTSASVMARIREEHNALTVLPVGMIDHSGVHFYIGGGPHWSDAQGWDSGTCGWIVLPKAALVRNGLDPAEVSEDDARKWLNDEIEEYDKWASGDVWGVVIKDLNGDIYESVWGFIGYEYALEEAKRMADDLP